MYNYYYYYYRMLQIVCPFRCYEIDLKVIKHQLICKNSKLEHTLLVNGKHKIILLKTFKNVLKFISLLFWSDLV